MKDHEARGEIRGLKDAKLRQDAFIESLKFQLNELRAAYDALFDVVASDLGYEAVTPLFTIPGTNLAMKCSPGSPRQFAKTVPQAELIRKPARFKKG